jgi:hypothetical protein
MDKITTFLESLTDTTLKALQDVQRGLNDVVKRIEEKDDDVQDEQAAIAKVVDVLDASLANDDLAYLIVPGSESDLIIDDQDALIAAVTGRKIHMVGTVKALTRTNKDDTDGTQKP